MPYNFAADSCNVFCRTYFLFGVICLYVCHKEIFMCRVRGRYAFISKAILLNINSRWRMLILCFENLTFGVIMNWSVRTWSGHYFACDWRVGSGQKYGESGHRKWTSQDWRELVTIVLTQMRRLPVRRRVAFKRYDHVQDTVWPGTVSCHFRWNASRCLTPVADYGYWTH